jgi:hypothetical protein
MRQSERGGPKQIGDDIEQRNDDAGIGLIRLLLMLLGVETVIDQQPRAEHEEPRGERDETRAVEQIERAAGEREQRKGADAARPPLVGMGEEVLEGEAEEEAQTEQERNADR